MNYCLEEEFEEPNNFLKVALLNKKKSFRS